MPSMSEKIDEIVRHQMPKMSKNIVQQQQQQELMADTMNCEQ